MTDWIEEIVNVKKGDGDSQFGEAEIINFIFSNIGTDTKFFVDLGANAPGGIEGGGTMSNTRHLKNMGFFGFGIDMNPATDEWIKPHFITPHNIVGLLEQYGTPTNFDLLNLDIDSCDFHVLKAILEAGYRPRIICTEINGTLDPNQSLVLKYEEGYTWDETNKYGYSFAAGKKLLEKFGYTIIFNQHDTNIFAVRTELLFSDREIAVTATQRNYHKFNPDAIWEAY